MSEFWNTRYSQQAYVYGKEPNRFFKETIEQLNIKGKMLFPAEGEGRNAVYAAKKGIEALAFDISVEAQKKALQLANAENVKIKYKVGDIDQLHFEKNSFDAIVLIFAHLPSSKQTEWHTQLAEFVKPNGYVILEGFSATNLEYHKTNPNIGGPQNVDMLFTKEGVQNTFSDFEIIKLEETETHLNEGSLHNGVGSVIQFIGRKNSK